MFSLAFQVAAPAREAALKVLHRFSGTSGCFPAAAMIVGADGNLYGTTPRGGTHDDGTLFQLTPAGVVTVLHSFSYAEGTHPATPLVQGADGSFYGVTPSGGANGTGTVFQVTPAGALTVRYDAPARQSGVVGIRPLAEGTDGNFYGFVANADAAGNAAFFRLTPQGKFTVVRTFSIDPDGDVPVNLVRGADGNFYGAVAGTGEEIVQVTPAGVLTVLHHFDGDGFDPGPLTLGRDGKLYGATSRDGANGTGTVFGCTITGGFTVLANFPGTTACSRRRPLLWPRAATAISTACCPSTGPAAKG